MTGSQDLSVAVRHRVHDSLTIEATLTLGAELGVMTGPSGAGKTTLLRLIAGLDLPEKGTIRAGNVVLTDRSAKIQLKLRDRRVGYVFQHDLLFPHLDVAENLRFGLRSFSRTAMTTRVAEVAALFGIGPLLKRRVGALSGGERQRVGLARAVAPRPRVLLCDEPVSALDLDARYLLLATLREVQRTESIPTLLVTHARDEAVAFGDRLFVLDRGQIVATGVPDEILANRPGAIALDSSMWRNVFVGVVAAHDEANHFATLALTGGPSLVVPEVVQPVGSRVYVRINSDEIVLARGFTGMLSAQNLLDGTIERIRIQTHAAEVTVRVGSLLWVVAIIAATISHLGIQVGAEVQLIIKARSCRLFPDNPGSSR